MKTNFNIILLWVFPLFVACNGQKEDPYSYIDATEFNYEPNYLQEGELVTVEYCSGGFLEKKAKAYVHYLLVSKSNDTINLLCPHVLEFGSPEDGKAIYHVPITENKTHLNEKNRDDLQKLLEDNPDLKETLSLQKLDKVYRPKGMEWVAPNNYPTVFGTITEFNE